jgi:hypothetical protein
MATTQESPKKHPKEQTPFVTCHELVAERAGYIVWKDSKLVIFILMI